MEHVGNIQNRLKLLLKNLKATRGQGTKTITTITRMVVRMAG
jgi:hypothetical protein